MFKVINLEKLFVYFLIAEKCVNITGYDPNFHLEEEADSDFLSILTNSSSYHYTGVNEPEPSGLTNDPLIGIKAEKFMYITFQR